MGVQTTQGTSQSAGAVQMGKGKQTGGKIHTEAASEASGTAQTANEAETGKTQAEKAVEGSRTGKEAPEGLTGREKLVWEKLDTRPQSAQELYESLSEDLAGKAPGMAELTDLLMNLVLKGLAGMERGNTYVRKNGRGACRVL